MTVCADCGKELGWTQVREGGVCKECFIRRKRAERNGEAYAREITQRDAEIDGILLTTETHPGLKIVQRIEIVTAACAFGMNIFKDLFSGVRDIVGGRS